MENLCICYSKCSTCRKALKYLDDNKIKYIKRDIVENNPNEDELKKWIKKSEIAINKWFNTSGILYRELNLKNKLGNMSEDEKIKLLASNGKLIKRPIFITDKKVLIGFKEDEWQQL